jgi:hypothetical protein
MEFPKGADMKPPRDSFMYALGGALFESDSHRSKIRRISSLIIGQSKK